MGKSKKALVSQPFKRQIQPETSYNLDTNSCLKFIPTQVLFSTGGPRKTNPKTSSSSSISSSINPNPSGITAVAKKEKENPKTSSSSSSSISSLINPNPSGNTAIAKKEKAEAAVAKKEKEKAEAKAKATQHWSPSMDGITKGDIPPFLRRYGGLFEEHESASEEAFMGMDEDEIINKVLYGSRKSRLPVFEELCREKEDDA